MRQVAHLTTTATGRDGTSPSVVVMELPPRRMITRGLLNGTSPALEEYLASATVAGESNNSSTIDLESSRRGKAGRRGAGLALLSASSSPSPSSKPTARAAHRGAFEPPTVVIGGVLRCVCNGFFVSAQETLLECSRCHNYCHPTCVEADHAMVLQCQRRQRRYHCPYCIAEMNGGGGGGTAAMMADNNGGGGGGGGEVSVSSPLYASPLSFTTEDAEGVWHTATSGISKNNSNSSIGGGGHSPTHSHHNQQLLTASRRPPVPRQTPLKLREVPDRVPSPPLLVSRLTSLLGQLRAIAVTGDGMGYDVLDLPAVALTDNEVRGCLDCCAAAVADATFSESYPVYCLREVCHGHHPFVQGTVLRTATRTSSSSQLAISNNSSGAVPLPPHSTSTPGQVAAMVLSNGMDGYGNLRATITQLKIAVGRGFSGAASDASVGADSGGSSGLASPTPFLRQCVAITDASDFVHVTLSATHATRQRRGLAKLLMAMDLLKWALRGRTRAFLNMAIEKRIVDGGTRVGFASSPASKGLYESFGFSDVFPRYDPETGKERWTAREADMGRVMANLDFVPDAIRVAEDLIARHNNSGSGNQGSGGRKRSRSSPREDGQDRTTGSGGGGGSGVRRRLALGSR